MAGLHTDGMMMSEPAKKTRITIRDVAAEAGVSKSLVSLVYARPAQVSERNRRLILETAGKLGFRPNWAARSLAASDGGFVGILMADLHSPAFAEIIDGARSRLKAAGHVGLMTAVSADTRAGQTSLDADAVTFFGDLRPTALLVVGELEDMSAVHPMIRSIPSVLAGASFDTETVAATVRTDNRMGMAAAVEHLTSLGHRSIVHIGGGGGHIAELRADAYRQAMTLHGLESEVHVEPADFSHASGFSAARRLLSGTTEFTAIVALSDYTAIGALGALAAQDRNDVAVIGYGDVEMGRSDYISLTTVRPNNAVIGARAAEELLHAMDAPRNKTKEVLIPAELIIRRSSTRGVLGGQPVGMASIPTSKNHSERNNIPCPPSPSARYPESSPATNGPS